MHAPRTHLCQQFLCRLELLCQLCLQCRLFFCDLTLQALLQHREATAKGAQPGLKLLSLLAQLLLKVTLNDPCFCFKFLRVQ